MLLKGNGICGGRVSGNVLKMPADGVTRSSSVPDCIPVLCGRCDASLAGRVISTFATRSDGLNAFILSSPDADAEKVFRSPGITAVSSFDHALFLDGDRVIVDGESGTVEIENVVEKFVVNCVVMEKDRMLILKRSDRVDSFQGKWSSVTGYVEEGETPVQTAFKELREELSVPAPVLLKQGKPVSTRKGGIAWISHPFLFALGGDRAVKIDWEHTDYRWIDIDELGDYETVPGLAGNLLSLGITSGTATK